MFHFLRLLIQLTMAPRNGWEDIQNDRLDPRMAFYKGFIPLCVISSAAVLFQLVYHPYLSVVYLIEKSVIQLVALFLTYYISEFFFSLYQIRNIEGSLNMSTVRMYLMMTVSEMALMMLVINMVPFSPVLMLLPLYVVVVMRMAVRFLGVSQQRIGHFMFLSMSTIFAPPLLIMLVFGYLTQPSV